MAMTMRPHRFPQSQTPKEDYLRYKKELARFIEWIYGEGYLPMPIDHTLAFNSNENDAICIQEVLSMVRNGHYFYFSDKTLNCQELKSIYSICDYVIGTRFHSVIFSLANKIPGIAITYTGNKAQGIMNDFGLKEYVISIDDVTCELLQEKFKRLVYDSYSNKKKIQKYLDYTVEVRNELINKIQESR